MTSAKESVSPQDDMEKLKAQIRLMAIAIQNGHERANTQQRILAQHEQRLERLERLATGTNEQN